MEYFLSHIGYIVVAALVIAVAGLAMTFIGDKNNDGKGIKKGCGMGCAGCGGDTDSCTLSEADIEKIKKSMTDN